eukprot:TRINITY_DN2538_c2_g3_i1.p1 TRINITY_DN2538_c2_g3~~TRINITY_DN2538_c2_g3_i1.p1  ORF type:complete len:767 (+),score=176.25 TRINITY_DN2538_c2_g3_i1:78-2378(+)
MPEGWRGLPCVAPFYSERDSVLQTMRKDVFMILFAVCGAALPAYLAMYLIRDVDISRSFFMAMWYFAALATMLLSLAVLAWTQRVSDRLILVAAVGLLVAVLCSDLGQRVSGESSWAIVVIIVDFLLVLRAPRWMAQALIGVVIVYLFVVAMERGYRFGLFDTWGLMPQERRREYFCDCEALPCAISVRTTLGDFMSASAVLLLDFFITRSFATAMTTEQERMAQAIEVAEAVAARLVAFDLEAAKDHLATGGAAALPPSFVRAFENLLANLDGYRPYLPAALIGAAEPDGAAPPCSSIPAPGRSNGTAAVMFTDVRASTEIWSACHHGMKAALRLHNACVRACLEKYAGYEVKTLGDAFMVAFADAESAARCGMEIQRQLLAVEWPEAVLGVPECAADANGLWGGLCLRIGVDSGPVELEENELTGRVDYFGDTVNRAARLEGQCPPGAIAGRTEVFEGVVEALRLPPDACREYTVALKGFGSHAYEITAVVPPALTGRWEFSHNEATRAVQQETLSRGAPSELSSSGHSFGGRSRFTDAGRMSLALGMVQSIDSATVMTLQLAWARARWTSPCALPTVGAVFERILRGLQATGGRVLSTVHSTTMLAWPSQQCAGHRAAAFKFAVSLARAMASERTRDEPAVHAGIAEGQVMTGSIGNATQRFLSTFGPSVPLSMHAADCAARDDVFALFAAPTLLPPRELHGQHDLVLHSVTSYEAAGDEAAPAALHLYEVGGGDSASEAPSDRMSMERSLSLHSASKENTYY